MPDPEPLGLLLISGGHERAHYAFVLAAGAAALGRTVILFATNEGCHALCADLAPLAESARDAAARAAGVAGIAELRAACAELGVRMIACAAGLRMAGLVAAPLLDGVEVGGVASFLAAVAGGQIVTL